MASKVTTNLIAVLVLVVLFSVSKSLKLKSCDTINVDPCRASTDQGEINLWPLARTKGGPRFQNVWETKSSAYFYSWNPCMPWVLPTKFNESISLNECQKDTSVCRTRNQGLQSYHADIGKASSAKFVLDTSSGICRLEYEGRYMFSSSVVEIELYCSTEEGRVETFTSTNMTSDNRLVVKTRLHSKYACPQKSISAGSILCIIFFSCLLIYLIGGVIWTKCSKGATGKEMIPNYAFWVNFFKLVQEGCMFTIFKIASLCTGGSSKGYETI